MPHIISSQPPHRGLRPARQHGALEHLTPQVPDITQLIQHGQGLLGAAGRPGQVGSGVSHMGFQKVNHLQLLGCYWDIYIYIYDWDIIGMVLGVYQKVNHIPTKRVKKQKMTVGMLLDTINGLLGFGEPWSYEMSWSTKIIFWLEKKMDVIGILLGFFYQKVNHPTFSKWKTNWMLLGCYWILS